MLTTPEIVAETPSASVQKFLGLHLPPDLNVLLPTPALTEILPITPLEITPVPESAAIVVGVYNWRGEVLWLVDLGYLFDQTPLFQQRYRQIGYSVIVIQFQNHALGLVVNQIGEIQTIAATDMIPADITPLPLETPIVPIAAVFQGRYQSPDRTQYWILDVDAIIDLIMQSIH
jgi:positive phototaxis protein PixI